MTAGHDPVLRYGPAPEHVADVRVPAGAGPHPVLLVLHGGYWRARHDRGYLDGCCGELAARGYLACNVEYRRVGQPGGGWPGTAEDVHTAVTALPGLLDGALPGAADHARTVLLGHSAGGHLALLAAQRTGGAGLAGVLAVAAVSDLAATAARRLDDGAAQEFLGGEPEHLPEAYRTADPMRHGPVPVPTVLVHGDADRHVPPEFSDRYADYAGARLRTVPGADHFAPVTPGSPSWPVLLDALADLVG